MLFFLDETEKVIDGITVGAIGAVAIPMNAYNGFCRRIYRIKQDELNAKSLDDKEIKGSDFLSKAAFKRLALSGYSPHLRTLDRLLEALADHGARVFALSTLDASTLDLRTDTGGILSQPYAHMLGQFARYMSNWPDHKGLLLLDQMGMPQDKRATCAIQNYMARHAHRTVLQQRLIQIPNFTHSVVSPGVQVADVVAYLAEHELKPTARPELNDWIRRFKRLSYRSSWR